MITALLAGGVLDAPGAVGNGLIDLLLLLGAGIHSRGVVLGGRGGRLGHDRLRRGGRGGAIPKDGVEVQVVAHLLDVDVPEQFIVAQGRGGVDAEPAVCRDPVGHRLAVHGAGHHADAAVKHCVGLDRCVVGVVVDVGRIAGDGHKVRAGGAVGAGAVIDVHAGAEPIIQLVIAELLAGHDVLAVALPVLGTLRQGGRGDGAGIVRGEGHRVVAVEGELVGVQVAQRLAGLGESRDRHADGQRGDTEGNGDDFGKMLFHDKVPFYVEKLWAETSRPRKHEGRRPGEGGLPRGAARRLCRWIRPHCPGGCSFLRTCSQRRCTYRPWWRNLRTPSLSCCCQTCTSSNRNQTALP